MNEPSREISGLPDDWFSWSLNMTEGKLLVGLGHAVLMALCGACIEEGRFRELASVVEGALAGRSWLFSDSTSTKVVFAGAVAAPVR